MLLRLFALFLALALPGAAQAGSPVRSGGNFGIGVGSSYWHSGLSLKYFMGQSAAVQGVFGSYGYGYGHDEGGGLGFSGDYLWEMPALTDNEAFELGWNAGLGPTVGLGDDWIALGVHGTLGLEFNFNPVPIDLVLEYKPGIFVVPGVGGDFWNFGGQIRVYPF